MTRVYVDVDLDDIIDDLDIEDLEKALQDKRAALAKKTSGASGPLSGKPDQALLESAYYDMRGTPMPEALREYFYRVLGKIA